MNKSLNITKYKQGFSILEVLVSSVIIITILSVLVFIGRLALANSLYAQEKAQAIYLAQEGIEIVRQIRDTNWTDRNNATQFDDIAWNNTNSALVPATSGTIYYPLFNTINGFKRWGLKNKGSSTDTDVPITDSSLGSTQTYKREIKIENTGSLLTGSGTASTDVYSTSNALKITSTVTWDLNGVQKSVSASEILTNWRPNF